MSIHTANLNLGGAGEIEKLAMRNCLMIAAASAAAGNTARATVSTATDSFECKTCGRKFPSFQALGGHRASHKKVKSLIDGELAPEKKPKIHACTICSQEFQIGQALGGHMRRHRPVNVAGGSTLTAEENTENSDGNNAAGKNKRKNEADLLEAREKSASCKRVWLGLNLKSSEEGKSEIEEGEIVEKEEKIDFLKLELRQPINNNYSYYY